MKLTKILQEVLSETGDASATGFSLSKPNLKNKFQPYVDKINSNPSKKQYGGEEPFKVNYTATIGENKYAIKISGVVKNVTPGTVPRFTYLFNQDGSKKPGQLEIKVDFDLKNRKASPTTGLNEQYKVLAAVYSSVIDFVNQTESTTPVDQIDIFPLADKGLDTSNSSKRAKFYMAYIQKNLNKLPNPEMWEVNDKLTHYSIRLSRIPPMPSKKKKK